MAKEMYRGWLIHIIWSPADGGYYGEMWNPKTGKELDTDVYGTWEDAEYYAKSTVNLYTQ